MRCALMRSEEERGKEEEERGEEEEEGEGEEDGGEEEEEGGEWRGSVSSLFLFILFSSKIATKRLN
jgi:hypothetical protein